jgi:hypothetical protein
MEDHGDKGGLFLLGTGIDKIQAPSHSWKRRYILIWKLSRFFFSFRKLFSCLLLGDSAVTLIFVSFFYRTQLPVKLRNRVRMNAIEPSDMFEYISRHFKAYNFNNMQSIQAKSLYISHVVSNFHGTQIEIWAGSRPVGNSKKKKKQG